MIRMTLDCVTPTQFSVIQTIHCNVGPKCVFFNFTKMLFVIIVMYTYFIDILQGSVETHLPCGGIYNMIKSKMSRFLANPLHVPPIKSAN